MRILVTSEKDIASQTIRNVLIEEHGFLDTGEQFEGNPIYASGRSAQLITTTCDMIHANHLEDFFNPDAFIFCSRHRSQSAKPALLVHSTGNLGSEALFGGNPRQLSVSTASLVSIALKRLHLEKEKLRLDQFDVSMEVTHHGPTSMNTPLVFVELGSDETYWRHEDGARAVALAVMDCISEPFANESVIGFGGTHYASKFNHLVIEKDIRIGHIAPKYALNEITEDILAQMISRSKENISRAVIDWKGTNAEQKAHILPMLESQGMEVIRAKNI